MCLYLENNNENTRVAKSNLVCYKVVKRNLNTKNLYTYYQHCEIFIGGTYYSELSKHYSFTKNKYDKEINKGLHTFTNLKDAKHFMNQKKGYFNHSELVLIKTIIPKDSTFYRGVFLYADREYKSYASDCLYYQEIIP